MGVGIEFVLIFKGPCYFLPSTIDFDVSAGVHT